MVNSIHLHWKNIGWQGKVVSAVVKAMKKGTNKWTGGMAMETSITFVWFKWHLRSGIKQISQVTAMHPIRSIINAF
jgi:hypothetical protein